MTVRPPAVAGAFYAADPVALRRQLDDSYAGRARAMEPLRPKAIVVPHAGYVYSGPIAATGYDLVKPLAGSVERVVLLGPSHRVPLDGLAVPSVDAFETPMGDVPIDDALRAVVRTLPQVVVDDRPHAAEHSVEVHLPFLLDALGTDGWTLLPFVVGRAAPADVADVLDAVWGGPETLVVVSTDLSHYHDHAAATVLDRATADAVLAGRTDDIADLDACGARPLRGLLVAAARHGLGTTLLDLRNSGDTAGDHDRVVGYGAFALA